MKYRKEIDGLRAIAVLPVIFFHAGFQGFSGGFIGVDVFFVTSGYLITSIILKEIEDNSFSLLGFYERRVRRILPALFFVMLVCILPAYYFMLPDELIDFGQSLYSTTVFLSNILFWNESGYFESSAGFKPLLHTWSLAVEEQYYLLFPFFMILIKDLKKKYVVSCLFAIFLCSFLIAQWGSIYKATASFYLLPTRGWEIMMGIFAAFILFNRSSENLIEKRIYRELLSFFGFLCIILSIIFYNETTPFPSYFTLLPTLGTFLLILFCIPETYMGKLFGNRILVKIGLISYSLYLWHHPLFVFSRMNSLTEPTTYDYLFLISISFLLAYFSWSVIEKPFRNRKNFNRSQVFVSSMTIGLLLICIGLGIQEKNGFVDLLSSKDKENFSLITEAHYSRLENISGGQCHFNAKGQFKDIDSFINNWNCIGETEKGSLLDTVAIFGDSHAADIAMALRQNNINVMQVTGVGCSFAIEVSRDDCKRLLMLFINKAKEKGINEIWIAKRFNKKDLEINHFSQMINDLVNMPFKIRIFSPMPYFYNFKRGFMKEQKISNFPVDLEIHNLFFNLENLRILNSAAIQIFNTKELICGKEVICPLVSNNKILMADETHMSPFGSKRFGERLLQTLKIE